MGEIEEIRADLEQFRKSGKPVYAYLNAPSAHDYYVSLPADKIYLGPEDPLLLKGMRAEIMYFKKTLDKLGVSVEVTHAGKYKDFGDMFTRSDMSAETREVMTSIVGGLYGNMVDRIAAGRKKSPDEVRTLIDQGPYTANGARKAGLVDELKFEDELWAALKDKLGATPVKVSAAKYAKVAPETAGMKMGSHVAILAAEGDIVMGSPSDDGTETGSITAYGLTKQLRVIGGDSSIQGGDGAHQFAGRRSDRVRRAVARNEFAEQEEAGGDLDVRRGGIGRLLHGDDRRPDRGVSADRDGLHRRGLRQAESARTYDKLGITKDAVQRGAHADIDSDYATLTPDERKIC